MSLDFLKQIKIDESAVPDKRKGGGGGGHRKQWNPAEDLLAIRVWKDGSVFPSKELMHRFALEYADRPVPKATTTQGTTVVDNAAADEKWVHPGNALDVFDSQKFPAFVAPKRLILANVVARAEGKADLFASVGWNEDGTKKSTVMEQGANSFGKESLVPLIKQVYGVELNDETPHIDLVFVGQDGAKASQHFKIAKGFGFVPKTYNRGDRQGMDTTVKRNEPWLFILLPLSEVFPDRVADKAKLTINDGVSVKGPVAAGDEPN